MRGMMAMGAATYPLFVAAVALGSSSLLCLASAVNGFGAGLLWIGQGIWLTRQAMATVAADGHRSIGMLTGLFFALFNTSLVLGNSLLLCLDYMDVGFRWAIWCLFVVAGAYAVVIRAAVDVNSWRCSCGRFDGVRCGQYTTREAWRALHAGKATSTAGAGGAVGKDAAIDAADSQPGRDALLCRR